MSTRHAEPEGAAFASRSESADERWQIPRMPPGPARAVLLTKLMPPVARAELVVRDRLHARLREGVDRA